MKTKLAISVSKMMVLGCAFWGGLVVASDQWAMNQANPSHTGYGFGKQ